MEHEMSELRTRLNVSISPKFISINIHSSSWLFPFKKFTKYLIYLRLFALS